MVDSRAAKSKKGHPASFIESLKQEGLAMVGGLEDSGGQRQTSNAPNSAIDHQNPQVGWLATLIIHSA